MRSAARHTCLLQVASKPSRKKASLTSPPADDDDDDHSSSSNNKQQVQTDSIIIPNDKLDIIICYNEKQTCVLIDTAISGHRYVITKDAEKILKYKDLIIEIQCMWKVKAKVIPIKTGRLEPSHNHSDSTWATYRESTKLRNYKKQPYWALHTNCKKC